MWEALESEEVVHWDGGTTHWDEVAPNRPTSFWGAHYFIWVAREVE